MGRKDKETVKEILVVKVINVYETNEGQKKMIRLVFLEICLSYIDRPLI